MKETLRHREAFEYYYSLGDKKSITEVARKFTLSRASISKWSKAFNWQDRIVQRDIENGKELSKKVNSNIVNSKADYRALIRQTVDLYKKKLDEGKIIINRPQDLETLAKLDLTLMGEATEITDNQGLDKLVDKFMELDLKDITSLIKELSKNKAN